MNDWLNYGKPFCAISLETYRRNAHRFTPTSTGSCSPKEPHALAWGPSSSHTEILRVERARLKIGEKLPTAYKFCTYWFIRYSSTCYLKVRIDPLMANIRNPDCFASPVVNASWSVVVRPCYLNRDLLKHNIIRRSARRVKNSEMFWVESAHDDVIKWKHFPQYCSSVQEIHRWPIPHAKASDVELWCFLWSSPWITGWVNSREAGDFRRHRTHYDVIVMSDEIHWLATVCLPCSYIMNGNELRGGTNWQCYSMYLNNLSSCKYCTCIVVFIYLQVCGGVAWIFQQKYYGGFAHRPFCQLLTNCAIFRNLI